MRTQKILKVAVSCVVVAAILILSTLIIQKASIRSLANETREILPSFLFTDAFSGQAVSSDALVKGQLPIVIIYFHPDCEYCKHEAKALQDNKNLTKNIIWVLVSAADKSKIQEFATGYNLHNEANFHFLMDDKDGFYKHFGVSGVPNIFIYQKDKTLVKHFRGETKLSTILHFANSVGEDTDPSN
ncbi:peroxiredoxin [uncultured Pontibacter sp.]|uniref:peroxiredoxin family protein n=1 Tax=uncultured Pontibacter sp. TaxID=453356 RepID=UPI00260D00CE|nr:redoxin domain-containing protein [uncultured Pontibacter sp.]